MILIAGRPTKRMSGLSTRTLSLTACFVFGCLSAAAQPSFNGKWEIDKKKSPGAAYAPVDLEQEIKHEDGKISVKSKYKEPKSNMYPLLWVGIMTYDLQLSADGTEKSNQIGPFTHVSKTSVTGNKMVTDFTANIENGKVAGQWIRTLSGDGKEMTLKVLTESSDGRKMDQTLVFKRK